MTPRFVREYWNGCKHIVRLFSCNYLANARKRCDQNVSRTKIFFIFSQIMKLGSVVLTFSSNSSDRYCGMRFAIRTGVRV